VLVCNHVSFVDPLVIAAASRRPIRFVMDHRIYRMPLIGFVFRHMHAIPIAPAREDAAMMEAAFEEVAQALEEGELVAIFPEGRITDTGELYPFRPGVQRIVGRTPVPVIPMALQGLWGSFFSRKDGPAMSRPLRRGMFSKIALSGRRRRWRRLRRHPSICTCAVSRSTREESRGRRRLAVRMSPMRFSGSALRERLDLYERLMRLDKPIGILLLLWPTLWGFWLSALGQPDWLVVWIFVLGTVLMRSAGCVINDLADRDFDPHVARTRDRPLAAGQVSVREALWLFAALVACAVVLVLPLRSWLLGRPLPGGPVSRCQLPVHQALPGHSAGLPRRCLRLRHPDGLRGPARPSALPKPGGCCWRTSSGRSPTTPSTRWSIASMT
jgi:1-acyl-sn-glycerol-3-phosphate acyltransferase